MRTDTLIRQLATGAGAVWRLPPLRVRLRQWLLVALATCGVSAILAVMGSGGPGAAAGHPEFGVQALVTFAAAVAAAASALLLSIPGRERPWITRPLPLVVLGSWVAGLIALVIGAGASASVWMAPPAAKCAAHVLVTGAPPGVLLYLFVRAGAPLHERWAGLMVAVAAGATGALATQLACANRDAAHLLLWHALPVLALAGAGMLRGVRAVGLARP